MAPASNVSYDDVPVGSTALVFDGPFGAPAGEVCPLLREGTDADAAALSVLLTGDSEAYLQSWAESGHRADTLRVVSVDPESASGAARDGPDRIHRVGSPSNLTALGVTVTSALDELDDDRDLVVCVDSLTALLQYVGPDRAGRFLGKLADRFDIVDAAAHVHVDPDAHERETVGSFAAVCDQVIEAGDTQPE